jgi:hypothetical protein
LVEQPFYGARTSYGDELRLSFGTSNEPTGRWRLGTRTVWLGVRRDGSIDLIPDDMPLADRQRRRRAA